MPPILQSDILMDLGPNHHPDLPPIYKTITHPLWNKKDGNIYYYIQDLTMAGMRKSSELEKRLCIPHGPESLALKKGRSCILPLYLTSY
jgi:hypothetical protein